MIVVRKCLDAQGSENGECYKCCNGVVDHLLCCAMLSISFYTYRYLLDTTVPMPLNSHFSQVLCYIVTLEGKAYMHQLRTWYKLESSPTAWHIWDISLKGWRLHSVRVCIMFQTQCFMNLHNLHPMLSLLSSSLLLVLLFWLSTHWSTEVLHNCLRLVSRLPVSSVHVHILRHCRFPSEYI